MTEAKPDKSVKTSGCAVPILIILAVLLATCIGGFVWWGEQFDDDPPTIGAPYAEGEAFLVMEALAGDLIAALPSEGDSPQFSYRAWKSSPCTWGWDGHNEWEGLVSVSISYEFHADYIRSETTGSDYADLIIAKLEDLGIEPDVTEYEKWNEKRIHAERDDGLGIGYNSGGLYINAGCVTDDQSTVFTPPHGGVPPAGDEWL
jgi:hypothetical protein